MRNILVTGCNRGIGLGLIRRLVQEDNLLNLIATCRNIEQAKELKDVAEQNKNVTLLQLDVRDFDQYQAFSDKVQDIVKEQGLNVLFNNAGVSPKSTRIQFVKSEQLTETFKVNTVAPIMLSKALLPLLKIASKNNSQLPMGANKALIVNASSILGSIAANTDGGLFPYRCSKAALNMATKSLSLDLYQHGIMVTSLHPGWVKTEMGGSNAPMDVGKSVEGILQILKNANETHNGAFYQWDGTRLDW